MTFKKYLLLLLCLPCFVQAKNITISRLTCEMQEGLVVVESCPRLGWAMESPENGTRQTAYEIEIREAFTGRSVWNSGKVTSSQSQLVPTEGADICLNNPFNYSWRVRVWDETDTPSEWSQEAKFRLASDDLSSGKWIGAITRKDSQVFACEERFRQERQKGRMRIGNPERKSWKLLRMFVAWDSMSFL